MAYDYYKVADEICDRLQASGLEEQAQRIKEAIASGSTGTEILMALRFEVGELLKGNASLDAELRLEIQSLISHINAALS